VARALPSFLLIVLMRPGRDQSPAVVFGANAWLPFSALQWEDAVMKVRSVRSIWSLACLGLALACAALTGCEHTTVEGPNKTKLTLNKPSDITVHRGQSQTITIKISRTNFQDPVTVSFDNLPQGVHVEDRDKKIGGQESTGTFTLRADDNAGLVENQEAKVTVTGPSEMKATEPFKISVKDQK
jgi:hypothetical protein